MRSNETKSVIFFLFSVLFKHPFLTFSYLASYSGFEELCNNHGNLAQQLPLQNLRNEVIMKINLTV